MTFYERMWDWRNKTGLVGWDRILPWAVVLKIDPVAPHVWQVLWDRLRPTRTMPVYEEINA